MATNKSRMYSLDTIPLEIFFLIAADLAPHDLAALALQNTCINQQVSKSELWKAHCVAWWPHAAVAVGTYNGNWHKMFVERANMPVIVPATADKIHHLTQQAQHGSSSAAAMCPAGPIFDQVLRSLETVRVAVQRNPKLKYTLEYKSIKNDLAWWVAEHAQAVVKFAKNAAEEGRSSLEEGRFRQSSLCDLNWKLNALEAIAGFGINQQLHMSVRQRLDTEVRVLRQCLVAAQA